MIRALISNLATLLLSLILALIIWFNALQVEDPVRSQFVQVPIEFVGQPESSILVSPTTTRQSVQLVYEGPASVLEALGAADFNAIVDLTQVPFGEDVFVPVQVQANSSDVTIQTQSIEQITVHLEQLVTRDIPVQLDIRGSVALGYVQGEPLVDPEFITVAGTASQVEPLDVARATVVLLNEREIVRRTPQPIFYNLQGRVASVSGLELSTEQVEVTIPVNESDGFAEKFINVDLVGDAAPGYRVVDVEVDPPSVLVQGRPTQLSALTAVRTEPIDITGLTETFQPQVALELPDGITLAEVEQIVVTVTIEPFRTTSIFSRTPQVLGLEEDMEIELSTETVRVVLFGPLPVLNALLEDEVTVVLDAFGLDEGVYNLEPDVDFPQQRGIELRSVQPAQVTVRLTRTLTTTTDITGTLPVTTTSSNGTWGETAVAATAALPATCSACGWLPVSNRLDQFAANLAGFTRRNGSTLLQKRQLL
ncbi:MAG: hypothetical protein KC425_19020 [Anaerolineales bacterium]|nr:hypothetical protein [Anaerolineales bacterium]